MDKGQEKELAIKATKLMFPDLNERQLRDHWEYAQFGREKVAEIFAYIKTIPDPLARNSIVSHIISALVLPIPPERRRIFLGSVIATLEVEKNVLTESRELMRRLKEHKEADNVTSKKNRK